jgi:hypothetical protein
MTKKTLIMTRVFVKILIIIFTQVQVISLNELTNSQKAIPHKFYNS